MTISDKSDDYNQLMDSRNSLQDALAFELANKLGFDTHKPLTIEDLIRVEKYLKNYQLMIINGDLMSEIVYAGELKMKKIILFYHDNHYDTVKSLPVFFSTSNFCFSCLKTYSSFETHPCNIVCRKC